MRNAYLRRAARRVDRALDDYLPPAKEPPARLHRAIRYAVLPGGKRIRPAVVFAVCEAYGGRVRDALPAACAVELIHSYSLVHDDLPCMDNDDVRRGRPSCHVRFGEATAVLVGDALQALAFGVVARKAPPALVGPLLRELSRWSGSMGLVGGQVLDLANGTARNLEGLRKIHLAKTAALFICSCRMGALSAGVKSAGDLRRAERYGRALGLLFQAVDDLLDSEQEAGKLTLPRLLGDERALAEVRRLAARARRAARGDPRLTGIVDAVLARGEEHSSLNPGSRQGRSG